MNCVICNTRVNWQIVLDIFSEILEQRDRLGDESLTEAQQIVCEGKCCSDNCYDHIV